MRTTRHNYWLLFWWIAVSYTFCFAQTALSEQKRSPVGMLTFDRVLVSDGLPSEFVNAIAQDRDGFMWFATRDGLARYDGYEMKIYQHNPSINSSLPANEVTYLYADTHGNLWVSSGVLSRFDFKREKFEKIDTILNGSAADKLKYVAAMLDDKHGNLWLGTLGSGLFKLNLATKQLNEIKLVNPDPDIQQGNWVYSIVQYNSDTLLIRTTGNQFFLIDCHTNAVRRFSSPKTNRTDIGYALIDRTGQFWLTGSEYLFHRMISSPNDFSNPGRFDDLQSTSILMALKEDSFTNIWVGSVSEGLFVYNRKLENLIQYSHDSNDQNSLPGNCVTFIYEDHSENMWVATNKGVAKWSRWAPQFNHYQHDPVNDNSINDAEVTGISESADGEVWLSTFNAGISRFNPQTGRFRNYTTENSSLLSDWAFDILAASDRSVWVAGNEKTGLFRFEPSTGKSRRYVFKPATDRNASGAMVHTLYEDRTGTIWAGTAGEGVMRLRPDKKEFERISGSNTNPQGFRNSIYTIVQADDEQLWIGSSNGLLKLDLSTDSLTQFASRAFGKEEDLFSAVNAIAPDADSALWVGTEKGLFRFNIGSKTFMPVQLEVRHKESTVYGILTDEKGNLWLQLRTAMLQYNSQSGQSRLFDQHNGWLQRGINISAWQNSFTKFQNSELIFGGSNGITLFHPEGLKYSTETTPVHITGFYLLYQRVDFARNPEGNRSEDDSLLSRSILHTDRIELRHNEGNFSFDFAALDYTQPSGNQYAYKLDGFQDGWVAAGNERRATYTNISPGNYTFRAKAANSAGLWNEEGDAIQITILPPWWRSSWAYALYAFAILLALYGWRRFEINRITMHNRLKIKELEAEKLRELDGLKSHFFANISHEFRTLLTLILGPLDSLMQRVKNKPLKEELSGVHRQAGRLLRLINQILDLSRLEAGSRKLVVRKGNFAVFLRGLVMSYSSLADQRQIQFELNLDDAIADQIDKEFYFDPDSFEKILLNLLSNAFKFTRSGGEIRVECTIGTAEDYSSAANSAKYVHALPPGALTGQGDCVCLSIEDSGKGISPENLVHVFERFYQAENLEYVYEEGSGIGLALVAELVKLHHGGISVSSKAGSGTRFRLWFPLGKAHLSENDIISAGEVVTQAPAKTAEFLPEPEKDMNAVNPISEPVEDAPIVLVIDDHPDIRNYVRKHLENKYAVTEAPDGVRGLETAEEIIPDLVISDLMMPGMDGFQVCEALKNNEKTSHIPVILLTARAEVESKLSGLKTGADAYLTKPFNAGELQICVQNLIMQRRQLRDRYLSEGFLRPADVAVASVDEQFLQRLRETMETHIPDENFDMNTLSNSLNMGLRQLQRKVKALTGVGAIELMRRIRLERAKQLFEQQAGNVSDIAYDVGFNNLSYFAKCFKDQFGLSPSEFIKQVDSKK